MATTTGPKEEKIPKDDVDVKDSKDATKVKAGNPRKFKAGKDEKRSRRPQYQIMKIEMTMKLL